MAFLSTNTWAPGDEVTSDQLNDLDSKSVMAIDGVGGGTYAAPLGLTNVQTLAITGTGYVTSAHSFTMNSGSQFNLNAGSNATLTGTVFHTSGQVETYNSGSQCDHNGATNYKSGSTQTHKSGSNGVWESGSTLTQNASATWNLHGNNTVIPGGVFFCSFGSFVTFVCTPDFTGGLTTDAASSTNLAGTITITGAANRLKMTTRDVTRVYCPAGATPNQTIALSGTTSSPSASVANGYATLYAATGVAQSLILPFVPPNGSTLKSVTIGWTGASDVTVAVYKNSTVLGTPNTSSTAGDKTITINDVVDTELYHYRMVLTRNSSGDVQWVNATAIYTVSEYAEC